MNKAVLGIVIKNDKFLLVHRKWPPCTWGPPGGFVDNTECEQKAVYREILEETQIKCQVFDKIHNFYYSDAYYNTNINVYACKYLDGDLAFDKESIDAGWFTLNELPKYVSPKKDIFIQAYNIIYDKI